MYHADTPYGNYSEFDSPDTWQDNFFPKKWEREMAQEKYRQSRFEILDDIADDFGLDTSEWDLQDYWDFMDMLEL